MLLFKMAFRNIFRQRRRTILTALTMIGGFVLLSFSFAISSGSYGSIINIFTKMHTGHLQIHYKDYLDKPSIYKTIDNYTAISKKLKTKKKVVAWTPRVYSPALIFLDKKTTGGRIVGIDPKLESHSTTLFKMIKEGSFFSSDYSNQIVVGAKLVEILHAQLGSKIVFIAQGADGSIANDIFTISGILKKSSNSFEQMNCYLPLKTAQEFLSLDGKVHEIAVILRHYQDSTSMAIKIKSLLNDKNLTVSPWQEVEQTFYKSMQADIKGMWVTLFIIMLIVGIGILNTVLMTILERTKEFGVIKALGTPPRTIFFLIVLEATFMSIISTLIGLFLSTAINSWFSVHGIKYPHPMDVGGITMTTMTAAITWQTIWIPTVVIIGTAITVSIFPALRAAHIIPIKAMRSS